MEIPEEVVRLAARALAKRRYYKLGGDIDARAAEKFADMRWGDCAEDARAALSAAGVGEMVKALAFAEVLDEKTGQDGTDIEAMIRLGWSPEGYETGDEYARRLRREALSSFTGGAKK
jgi:hypothetical protein